MEIKGETIFMEFLKIAQQQWEAISTDRLPITLSFLHLHLASEYNVVKCTTKIQKILGLGLLRPPPNYYNALFRIMCVTEFLYIYLNS